jgi:hypothetical protein
MPTRIQIARGSKEAFDKAQQNSKEVQLESNQDGTLDNGSEGRVEPIP